MNIPEAAVEAAAKVIALSTHTITEADWEWEHLPKEHYYETARLALEVASPRLLDEAERELRDAKRMIALLVLEAGGKVAISRRAVTELSDETVIATMQDVVNGGWVIRARVPSNG